MLAFKERKPRVDVELSSFIGDGIPTDLNITEEIWTLGKTILGFTVVSLKSMLSLHRKKTDFQYSIKFEPGGTVVVSISYHTVAQQGRGGGVRETTVRVVVISCKNEHHHFE